MAQLFSSTPFRHHQPHLNKINQLAGKPARSHPFTVEDRPSERSTYFAEFMVDDLVRADIAARFEAYAKAVSNGILSGNEVRAMENRPPLPGGDDLRVPMNSEPATEPVT